MSNRITERDLHDLCKRLNEITGNPVNPYIDNHANVGNYHINFAYGGVQLHQTMSKSGGIKSISSGYTPKRELYNFMQAYLGGLSERQ